METPNAFLSLVPELRQGDTQLELHSRLLDLVEQVTSMGRPGELHLKLKVEPPARAGGPISVIDEVVLKAPKTGKESTVLFVDAKTKQLTRRDPRQPKLPDMEKPADVRSFSRPVAVGDSKVNPDTGEIVDGE